MNAFARGFAGACAVFAMAILISIGVYRVVFEFRRPGRARTELANAGVVPTITNLVFISNTVVEAKGYGIIIYYTPWGEKERPTNTITDTNISNVPEGQYRVPPQ